MENASEALRIAGGVLIFVLALSISIYAFTMAREGIDTIAKYSDREFWAEYVEQNNGTRRIVGAESIVPTIYRAYKENIKIEFDFLKSGSSKPLYFRLNSVGPATPIYEIDLEKENINDEKVKEYIIRRILFGSGNNRRNNVDSYYDNIIQNKINVYNTNNDTYFNEAEGLYGIIKGNEYEEYLGVYYQEETNGTNTRSTANKTEKKVITYTSVTP